MASKKKKPTKKIKVKLAYYIVNAGDGSAYPKFFVDETSAEDYAKGDDERFCEYVGSVELIFDEKGKLLNPSKKKDW